MASIATQWLGENKAYFTENFSKLIRPLNKIRYSRFNFRRVKILDGFSIKHEEAE